MSRDKQKATKGQYRVIIPQLIRREISERYRGSVLGILWSLITPLILLAVYTFVFGILFEARWEDALPGASNLQFAMILFAGLTVFQLFADVLTRAPTLILSHSNYVKKVVFPLEVLVPVSLGSALFHAMISFIILLVLVITLTGRIPLTALLFPVVLIPFCVMIVGLAWGLAAIGVYLRDIGQIIGTFVTAMMFLAPIFYPPSVIPDWASPYVAMNPIVVPVNAIRDILVFGRMPDWSALGIYSAVSVIMCIGGLYIFQKTRKGFADVL
ncbi:ABC transporter permease [Fretibacter rubidus]|uniref:ABC transporter permease n=1 Tax=Fretibacter rubidus TaxID=570162 RepID=UPI00352BC2ED